MQRALPAVVLAVLLSVPAGTVWAAYEPEPGGPLTGPLGATLDAATESGRLAEVFSAEAYSAAAAAFEGFARALGEDRIEPEPLLDGALAVVAAGAGFAGGEAGVAVRAGDVWTDYASAGTVELVQYANATALVAFDGVLKHGIGNVTVVTTDAPQADLPVAPLFDGRYNFTIRVVDLRGAPVPLGDWRLDVIGLEATPVHGQVAVPGLAGARAPLASKVLLLSVQASRLADSGAVLDPAACAGAANCAKVRVPAAALKLERLYSGSPVFLRFTPDAAAPVPSLGWHNVVANAAYAASGAEAALPPLRTETPAWPEGVGGSNETKGAEKVLRPLFGAPVEVTRGPKRTLVAADVLDQFPTGILLAPQAGAGPDPDGDGWPTTTELALNSDPFDFASRPGRDEDGDGLLNYQEDSRAGAVDWTRGGDEVEELEGPAHQRVPLAGVAVVASEHGPAPHRFLPDTPSSLGPVEVLDLGVAGPPSFTLDELRLANLGTLRGGDGKELQRFTLFVEDPAQDGAWRAVRSWRVEGGRWVSSDGGVDCLPSCEAANATTWTLPQLGLPAKHALRFHLTAAAAPGALNWDDLDHRTIWLASDPAHVKVTVEGAPAAPPVAGPLQQGPLHDVDVRAARLVSTDAPGLRMPLAGVSVPLTFCGVDALASLDLDYGAGRQDAMRFTFAQGGLASPNGRAPEPDLARGLDSGPAVQGCRTLDLTLFRARSETVVRAEDLTGLPVRDAPLGPPIDPVPAAAAQVVVLDVPRGGEFEVSADDQRVRIAVEVRDAFGNVQGAGVPITFTFADDSTAEAATDAAGRAAAIVVTGHEANTYFNLRAASGTGSAVAVVRVVPGALFELRVETQRPEPEPVRRAMLGTHPLPVEADDVVLYAHGFDQWGNARGETPSRWSADESLAEGLGAERLAKGHGFLVAESDLGGIAGELTATALEDPDVRGSIALAFTGRAPPTIALGCEPPEEATTGDPFAVCATVTDDVADALAGLPNATVVQGGVATDHTFVPEGDGFAFRLPLLLPADSLAPVQVTVRASDVDDEPLEIPIPGDGILVVPVGGTSTRNDTFDVRDDDAPTLTVKVGTPQLPGAGGVPIVRSTTPVDLTAADNVPGRPVTIEATFADGRVERSVGTMSLPLAPRPPGAPLQGSQTIGLVVRDVPGNRLTPDPDLDLVIDDLAPTSTLVLEGVRDLLPDGTRVVSLATVLKLEASDLPAGGAGVDKVLLSIDGGAFRELAPGARVPALAAGRHNLTFQAMDRLGNLEQPPRRESIEVDASKPGILPLFPKDKAVVGTRALTLTLEVRDNGPLTPDDVRVLVNNVPVPFTTNVTSGTLLRVEAPLLGLLEGPNTVEVHARDDRGNPAELGWTFRADTTPPVVRFTSPAAGSLLPTGPVAVAFAVDDATAVDVACRLVGSAAPPVRPCASPVSFTLGHGVHEVLVEALDEGKNPGSARLPLTADGQPPTVALEKLPIYQPSLSFELVASASDPHLAALEVQVQRADGTWATVPNGVRTAPTGPERFPYTAPSEPLTLTFRAVARDLVENAAATDPQTTIVDTAKPVTLLDPLPAFVRGTVAVAGQAGLQGRTLQNWTLAVSGDNGATFRTLKLQDNGQPTLGVLATWDTRFEADGPKVLKLTAISLSGLTESATARVTVDNTRPAISALASATHPSPTAWSASATATVSWSLTENGSGLASLTCTLVGPAGATTLASCPNGTPFAVPQGAATFHVDAADRAGNAATRQSVQLLTDSLPPAITPSSTPAEVPLGQRAIVSAAVSDLGASGLRSVVVRYTGGSTVDLPMTPTGGLYTAVLPAFGLGSVPYTIRATDGAGSTSVHPATGAITLTVRDNTPPTVRIVKPRADATTLAGSVEVAAAVDDVGSGVASVAIELRDGSGVAYTRSLATGSGTVPHTIPTASVPNGDYTLAFTVTDRSGNRVTATMPVVVANVPNLGAPTAQVGEDFLNISATLDGGPSAKVWLYHSLSGEIQPRITMLRAGGGAWYANLTGLAPGDVVNYFLEAEDGRAASRQPADGSTNSLSLPIPEAQLTDLEAWQEAAHEVVQEADIVRDTRGHEYINITLAQFTHDGVTATFAFDLAGAFPDEEALGGDPIPRYLVEFDTDGDNATKELTLRATYPGADPAGSWTGVALDVDGKELPSITVTVVPDLPNSALAMRVPVTQLATQFGAAASSAQAGFRALGSEVSTSLKPFDIAEPKPAVTPPGTVRYDAPLVVQASVTDNRLSAGVAAQVELTVNSDLHVLKATVDTVTGAVTILDPLPALLPGTAALVVTAVDAAGNAASSPPLEVPVVDLTPPDLGAVTLGGQAARSANGAPLAQALRVEQGATVRLLAPVVEAIGLADVTVDVEGARQALGPAPGGHAIDLTFDAPGTYRLVVRALDLASNAAELPITVVVPDVVPPVIGVPLLRLDGAPLASAEELAVLDASKGYAVSALVTDNAGPEGLSVTVQVFQPPAAPGDAPRCSTTRAPEGLAPIDVSLGACGIGLGPLEVRVEATDGVNTVSRSVTLVRQDLQAPRVAITRLDGGPFPQGFTDAESPTMRITITDDVGLAEVRAWRVDERVPGSNVQLLTPAFSGTRVEVTVPTTGIPVGNHRVVIVATDRVHDPATGLVVPRDLPPFEQPLVITDQAPPRLLLDDATPEPGEVMPSETVVFAGRVLDPSGLAPGSFGLAVDGVTVPARLVTAEDAALRLDGVRFEHAVTLAKGRHEVRITARDPGGMALERSWGFYVLEIPVAPRGAATSPAPSPAPAPPPPRADPCADCLVRSDLPATPPPPAQAPVPALTEPGQAATVALPSGVVTSVDLVAEGAVAGARVVARELGRDQQMPHAFEALYRQVEIVVEEPSGDVAPVVLETIAFRIPRGFVDGQGLEPGTAVLAHFEDEDWAVRETTLVDADGGFYHYEARHGGRSTFAIVFDRAPPVVELLVPQVANVAGVLPLEAVARDDIGVKDLVVTLDGATIGSGAPVLRLTVDASTLAQVAAGVINIVAEARDATGKTARALKTVIVERDAPGPCPDLASDLAAPVTTLAFEGGDAAMFGDILGVKGPVDVRFAARDEGPDGCRDPAILETRYRVDDGPVLAGLRVSIPADQPHTLEYWSVDRKGNEEGHRTLRIVPAEGASQGGGVPVEPLEVPKKGAPGFDAAFLLAALALAGLALRRRRPA